MTLKLKKPKPRPKFNKEKPGWKDGVLRYRCPTTDLWRRYYETVCKDNNPTKGWEITGETDTDDIGEYVLAKNGAKIYTFPRPIKAYVASEV